MTKCEEYKNLIRQRVEWAKRVHKRNFRHLYAISKVAYTNNLITVDFKNKVVLDAKN